MIRGYDTSALHWKDKILRIRHLEAEIASMQKKIERQKLFSAGHQPAPGRACTALAGPVSNVSGCVLCLDLGCAEVLVHLRSRMAIWYGQ